MYHRAASVTTAVNGFLAEYESAVDAKGRRHRQPFCYESLAILTSVADTLLSRCYSLSQAP